MKGVLDRDDVSTSSRQRRQF